MNDTRYTAIAAALREEFPKANKGTVSMALHTNDYGVKFCTRAQEIYDAVTQQKPRRSRRAKPIRLQCRLTESTAQRVKQALERKRHRVHADVLGIPRACMARTKRKRRRWR